MPTVNTAVENLTPEALRQAAECLRTLSHPHRLQIVQLLMGNRRFTVGELADACQISQPQMSDHLRLMQRCQFLTAERQGREVHYRICEPHVEKLMACIALRFGRPSDSQRTRVSGTRK